MKRLYNEYSACPDEGSAKVIRNILTEALDKIWQEVEVNDICPRDAKSLCQDEISVVFSENILRKAMNKRNLERMQKRGLDRVENLEEYMNKQTEKNLKNL
jgi:hypothetical protein